MLILYIYYILPNAGTVNKHFSNTPMLVNKMSGGPIIWCNGKPASPVAS